MPIRTTRNSTSSLGFYFAKFIQSCKQFVNDNTELTVIVAIFVLSTVAHSWNMFNFPTLWDDEGFYTAQAWAVSNSGNLSLYTYWYDHTPAGWLFLAMWNMLARGLMDFTPYHSALLQGRIFIILLNGISSILVYLICRKITTRRSVSVIATLFFCISPLAVFFHRQVYLDNIMIFWFLISLFFLIKKSTLTLSNALISSLTFSIAVLSKETAIVFLPIMIFILLRKSQWQNRFFVISTWIITFVLVMSMYPMYALLKGELFPYGSFLGGKDPHVSLIESINFQINRKGEFFLYTGSKFQQAFYQLWFTLDGVLIILGAISTILNLIFFRKHPWSIYFSALSVFYCIYLIRSIALDFYIIPLIPILVFNIAIVLDRVINFIEAVLANNRYKFFVLNLFKVSAFVLILVNLFTQMYNNSYIFTSNQNVNHFNGIQWAQSNIRKDSLIVTDMSAFADMNYKISNIKDTNVHSFWAAAFDPAIRDNLLDKKWDNIDYLLVNNAFIANSASNLNATGAGLGIVDDALKNSRLIKDYSQNTNKDERLSNGNFQILEVNNKSKILKSSWDYYKQNFIKNGRVIDPKFDTARPDMEATTSEGQSYALLRSVWMDDQGTFDQVFAWLNQNMKQDQGSLYSWLYGKNPTTNQAEILDVNNASDGDTDIALALIMAQKLWGQNRYLDYAKSIISDLYQKNINTVDGLYYYLPSTIEQNKKGKFLMNPSYFSPAHFREFAKIDPENNWSKVASDGYTILNKLSATNIDGNSANTNKLNGKNLPPNWFAVNQVAGEYTSAKDIHDTANYYSYDAFRTFWRVSLDAKWNSNESAKKYLKIFEPYFADQWAKSRALYSVADLGGNPQVGYTNPAIDTGALSVMWALDNDLQYEIYLKQIEYNMTDRKYWNNKDNYYDQNWGWFSMAMYSNNLIKPDDIKAKK